ncbi:type 4 prepilin peptidase 1 [Cohnella lupini]|uniref:Type 4 prepilin peptidase 1 n=2 Tax=Cohnella lupini TaxID=1294267 RepID=A0A3D9IIY9_9BACL|nr:type 4 prepilin peptidase 1 [Cohnella lupini]
MGMAFGSFFNVVAIRIPSGLSVVRPPSQCPECGMRLKSRDLIPVFSYLFTLGKCRGCHSRVSPVYPLGESVTGILFAWAYLNFGLTWELHIALTLISLCVIVTITDLRYRIIPNRILLFFVPIVVVLQSIISPTTLGYHALGAISGGGILLLIALISKGGMGMGDVKLLALLGFIVGFPNVILVLIVGCFIGTLIGGALIVTGVTKRNQPIPFGPFLALGALIAYGYGSDIIQQYLSIFAAGM